MAAHARAHRYRYYEHRYPPGLPYANLLEMWSAKMESWRSLWAANLRATSAFPTARRLTALLLLCRWLSLGADFGGGLRVEYVRMEDVSDEESRRAWLCGLIRRHPTLRKCCDGSDDAVARAATVAASLARRRSPTAGDNRSAPAVAAAAPPPPPRHPSPIVEQCCAAGAAPRAAGAVALKYSEELTAGALARINEEVAPALLRRLGYAPQGSVIVS